MTSDASTDVTESDDDRALTPIRLASLRVDEADAELAADRLWVAGARSVEELGAMEGRVELRAALGSDDAVSRSRLGELPDRWELAFFDVDPRPAETWKYFARPIVVNDRLLIRPAWCPPDEQPGVLDVSIEPGGSFGLGDHPTTRLSAAAVDELVAVGDRVLDVGCGSGVLAIIAAHRGAVEVVATDIAEAAREATLDNAVRNGVQATVTASTRPLGSIEGCFDVVVANILAPALVDMASDLRRVTAADGHLVISGVLAGAHDHVIAALAPMQVVSARELDGWAAVTLAHAR